MSLEFYIEKAYHYGANTIRYNLDGSHYYLCAEGNRVFLQVSYGYEIIISVCCLQTATSQKQITLVEIKQTQGAIKNNDCNSFLGVHT